MLVGQQPIQAPGVDPSIGYHVPVTSDPAQLPSDRGFRQDYRVCAPIAILITASALTSEPSNIVPACHKGHLWQRILFDLHHSSFLRRNTASLLCSLAMPIACSA